MSAFINLFSCFHITFTLYLYLQTIVNFSGPKFWNTIPTNLRQLASIHQFKKKLSMLYNVTYILYLISCTYYIKYCIIIIYYYH